MSVRTHEYSTIVLEETKLNHLTSICSNSKMSTTITPTQTATILPKSVAMLKRTDEKPRLGRSSSMETIKRINTYICSPQSYLLPAILTTWFKTSQNGLQSSTEKTIILFRSLIFGSFLVKYLLRGVKSGQLGAHITKVDLQKALVKAALIAYRRLLTSLNDKLVISVIFKVAVVFMAGQLGLCLLFLAQSIVPLGLSFLILSLITIVVLEYRLNRYYYGKRNVKRKIQ